MIVTGNIIEYVTGYKGDVPVHSVSIRTGTFTAASKAARQYEIDMEFSTVIGKCGTMDQATSSTALDCCCEKLRNTADRAPGEVHSRPAWLCTAGVKTIWTTRDVLAGG